MNAIGIGAAIVFVVAWAGAAVSVFAFDLIRLAKAHAGQAFWTWPDTRARRRFLIFIGFCALGPLSVLAGLLFGNWAMS